MGTYQTSETDMRSEHHLHTQMRTVNVSWPEHVVRWHATWKIKCNQKWFDETTIRRRGIIASEYLNIWCLSLPLSLLTLTPALGQSTGFLEQFSDEHNNAFSKTHHPLLSPWVCCYQQSQSGPVSCHLFWVDFTVDLSQGNILFPNSWENTHRN